MNPTLADMTPVEQDLRVGTWFELLGASYPVILASPDEPYDGYATVMVPGMAKTTYTPADTLTPRLDLPRIWTPSGEPVPGEWVESPSSEHHHRWCARWEKKPDELEGEE